MSQGPALGAQEMISTTQLLCSFFLQCVKFLLFWSNTSFYGFANLGLDIDWIPHIYLYHVLEWNLKTSHWSPTEAKKYKSSIENCSSRKTVGFLDLFRKRQWWTKGFINEGRTLVEYLSKPNLVADFCGHLFVCVYQGINLQFLIPLL